MRIKKITPTNRYKHIDFGRINDDWDGREVFTPNGWSSIKIFGFIKRDRSKIIKTKYFDLICDRGHELQVWIDGQLYPLAARELDPTSHKLMSYNGPIDFEISDGEEHDFYDIEIDNPHWWFTSSVVSHNSIVLCNNAISSLQGERSGGEIGQDVLLITFELDNIKTAMRCLGAATGVPLDHIPEKQDYIRRMMRTMERTYKKKFAIYEWPPDECSVIHIYALLDNLKRTKGWKPDVVIIDYLDLMVSRNEAYNKDDYTRQKHVANEIRGLAKNEEVLVFTATQTNRSGASSIEADLNVAAESFAKQFSLDYVVSLNQSKGERISTPPRIRLFVAKNRNGPKHVTVECSIEYDKMQVREI